MTALGPAALLSETEVRALLGTFSRRAPTGVRNYALVMLLWRTGLRLGEALALAPADLTLDGLTPRVRAREGKGGVFRTVGLHQEAVTALVRWLDVRARRGLARRHYVFVTLAGEPLDQSYVRQMLAARGRRAGIARCHPHAFRASLAVDMHREGVPVATIPDVLRHKNLATTDAYLRRQFPADALQAVIHRTQTPA